MARVRGCLRFLDTADAPDLEHYIPEDPDSFCLWISFIAGPEADLGEEIFQVGVCTAKWLQETVKYKRIMLGRHFLIVDSYDYATIHKFIKEYCSSCEGATWNEVALKLGRLGRWEFEDYNTDHSKGGD